MSENQYFEKWMRQAIDQASRGIGLTAPNPPVGCVIIRKGRLVGSGYHRKAGKDHAEIAALKDCSQTKGADVFVTLEPCSTTGRTGPCTEALIQAGVKRVVFGCPDPTAENASKAKKILTRAGVEVVSGVLKEDCEGLIRSFKTAVQKGRPYITLKLAQSLDGKIAASDGSSKWISGDESRKIVHEIRKTCEGILVGVSTVRADNPSLDIRPKGKSPWYKVVADSRLILTGKERIFSSQGRAVVLTTRAASVSKIRKISTKADVIICRSKAGRIDLKDGMRKLCILGIHHLLVEGGSEISGSMIDEQLCDDLYLFTAPILIGGNKAPVAFGGKGAANIQNAVRFKAVETFQSGQDIGTYGVF